MPLGQTNDQTKEAIIQRITKLARAAPPNGDLGKNTAAILNGHEKQQPDATNHSTGVTRLREVIQKNNLVRADSSHDSKISVDLSEESFSNLRQQLASN